MCRGLDRLDLATDVKVLYLVAKIRDRRMRGVVRAENLNRLFHSIRKVYIIDFGGALAQCNIVMHIC